MTLCFDSLANQTPYPNTGKTQITGFAYLHKFQRNNLLWGPRQSFFELLPVPENPRYFWPVSWPNLLDFRRKKFRSSPRDIRDDTPSHRCSLYHHPEQKTKTLLCVALKKDTKSPSWTKTNDIAKTAKLQCELIHHPKQKNNDIVKDCKVTMIIQIHANPSIFLSFYCVAIFSLSKVRWEMKK